MRLTPDNIADYAETLILQAAGGGRILDYSPESMAVLEELIRVSDELLLADDFPERQRNLLIFYNGCYLGETMARTLGGVWRFEEIWYDSSLIFARGDEGIEARPFAKMHRRVTEGPSDHDLVSYYIQLKDLLNVP